MNEVPDDVLRLLFEAYVHDLKCSPAGLLTVNRRWHAVSLDTRNLWARVTINIDSFDVIPFLTGFENGREQKRDDGNEDGEDSPSPPCPLQSYLNRSCSLDGNSQYPLDIRVVWYPHQGYISLPSGVPDPYRDPPPLNQYDKSYIPYFTVEDHHICSLQMQILVHFLFGINVQLEPSEMEENDNDQVEEMWYNIMGIIKNRPYIAWLKKAVESMQNLTSERVSAFSSKYCSISLARKVLLPWRSVEFDLYRIAGSMDIGIPVIAPVILQHGVLTSLESVELRGVSLFIPGVSTQSIRYLELKQSSHRSLNDLGKLEVLRLEEGALKANNHFLSQMEVPNLHTLQLFEPLETGRWWRTMMEKLESIFTEPHPLTSLTLCPKLMGDTVNIFIQYLNFCIRKLHISSQYLGPLDMNGDISSQIVAETRYLLREMKSRGVQVYPVDIRMSKALELAAAGGGSGGWLALGIESHVI